MTKIKCTLVGSDLVGKSTLIKTFLTGSYYDFYLPSLFDFYCMDFMYENIIIQLKIQDTCPNLSIDKTSQYVFPDTNIFIACFSLVCPTSLKEINFYVNYIKKRFRKSIFILVGLKSDIRDDLLEQKKGNYPNWFIPIETEKGEQKKVEINALDYIECSSKENYNVQTVFELAIKYSIKYSKQDNHCGEINSCCNIF